MSTVIALPRHKLTVTDYHRMIRTGILTDDDHLELIEGDLIEIAPAGPEHADVVAHVGRIFRTQTTFLVREGIPVTLPEYSEPEPDIALVKPDVTSTHTPAPGLHQRVLAGCRLSVVFDLRPCSIWTSR